MNSVGYVRTRTAGVFRNAVLELTESPFFIRDLSGAFRGGINELRAAIVCEPSLVNFAEAYASLTSFCLQGRRVLTGDENVRVTSRRLRILNRLFTWTRALSQSNDSSPKRFFPKVLAGVFEEQTDYKSQLQENVQREGLTLRYAIIEERGPAHSPNLSRTRD